MPTGREAGFGVLGLVAGAVIGGLTWSAMNSGTTTTTTGTDATNGSGQTNATDLAAENERLRTELDALRAEANREAVAAKKTPEPEEPAKKAAPAALTGKPIFADERFAEALAAIDWAKVGTSMKDMTPLLAQLAEALEKGEAPDLAVAGEVQKLNGELLKAAQQIMQAKIPGSGVNGAFTHPVVVANQFAAALQAAGVGLSDEQKESLERAMKFYASKDESLRLAAGDKEFDLAVIAEESEFKAAFYDEAKGLLSKEQRDALFSKHTKGRGGFDIFDSSLMLMEFARPVQVKNADELAARVAKNFSKAPVDAANRKKLEGIIQRWSKALPADFWAQKATPLDRRGSVSSARMRQALKRQTALFREIFANVELDPAARAELMKMRRILVPVPR